MQMPVAAPRPPEIAHAVHEYHPAETAAAGQQPVFTLAMNDGSRHAAILVWVQNGPFTTSTHREDRARTVK